ncbi:hypothetical protein [Sediminivirga luteola]|nr:hypothetical protein [Sediminivirga luteola]
MDSDSSGRLDAGASVLPFLSHPYQVLFLSTRPIAAQAALSRPGGEAR